MLVQEKEILTNQIIKNNNRTIEKKLKKMKISRKIFHQSYKI